MASKFLTTSVSVGVMRLSFYMDRTLSLALMPNNIFSLAFRMGPSINVSFELVSRVCSTIDILACYL